MLKFKYQNVLKNQSTQAKQAALYTGNQQDQLILHTYLYTGNQQDQLILHAYLYTGNQQDQLMPTCIQSSSQLDLGRPSDIRVSIVADSWLPSLRCRSGPQYMRRRSGTTDEAAAGGV